MDFMQAVWLAIIQGIVRVFTDLQFRSSYSALRSLGLAGSGSGL